MAFSTFLTVFCLTFATMALETSTEPQIRQIVYEFGSKTIYDTKPFKIAQYPRLQPTMYLKNFKADIVFNGPQKVTYVKVVVDQDSDQGYCMITRGAIGTDILSIALSANIATVYNYTVEYYESPLVVKTYQFGNTMQNDVVLARTRSNGQYASYVNCNAIIKYPGSHLKGQNITSVIVKATQLSNIGQAIITNGKLESNELEITLTAENTKILSSEVVFYTTIPSKSCSEDKKENSTNETHPHHKSTEFIYFSTSD